MAENLREVCAPVLGTLRLLLGEIRLLLDDGSFGQVQEDEEATTVVGALVDGTGIRSTHVEGQQ